MALGVDTCRETFTKKSLLSLHQSHMLEKLNHSLKVTKSQRTHTILKNHKPSITMMNQTQIHKVIIKCCQLLVNKWKTEEREHLKRRKESRKFHQRRRPLLLLLHSNHPPHHLMFRQQLQSHLKLKLLHWKRLRLQRKRQAAPQRQPRKPNQQRNEV